MGTHNNEPVSYAIIPTTELGLVDFSQTLNSVDGVRYSLDGTKCIIKWTHDIPEFMAQINPYGIYTTEEILNITRESEWEPPEDV